MHIRNTYTIFSCGLRFSFSLSKNLQHLHDRYLSPSILVGNAFCLKLKKMNENFEKLCTFSVFLKQKLLYYKKNGTKIMRPAVLVSVRIQIHLMAMIVYGKNCIYLFFWFFNLLFYSIYYGTSANNYDLKTR